MKWLVGGFVALLFVGPVVVRGEAPPPAHRFRTGSVSEKNLVTSSRARWESGSLIWDDTRPRPGRADSVRVLALMAQFEQDEDEKTTGDGRFDLSEPEDLVIDPPPHDRRYFEHQLLALRNYYLRVSQGRLRVGFTVHPDVIDLPNPMGHYNPAKTAGDTDRGLAELFRDAIELADAGGVPFSAYDALIVFHAGVGRDFDLGYDPTPKDIPSAFLNLRDLRKHLAGGDAGFRGIAVEDGSHHVTEGIILPETQNQDGYEIGLLGTAALMFGFQLGLPALWNTETGVSGIGRWGLMDQGSGNYNGLIPAEPCAWSKVFMGWETPVTLHDGAGLRVACSKARSAPRIYRVPIHAHEYYLVENRQYDPNGDGVTTGTDADGRAVTFTAAGLLELTEPIGVITGVEEYDFGLPGSGILIWHIDESVLSKKLEDNRVNADRHHRAVNLREADGAQDIGEYYGFLHGGAGAETGVLHDAWFAGNEIHMLVNGSEVVAFTPRTHPGTRSNTGAHSHLVFSDFSVSDTVMTYSVSNERMQAGFPRYFPAGLTPYPALYGDLDGDGFPEIVVATREGAVYAWRHDGEPVVPDQPVARRVTVSGDSIAYAPARLTEAGGFVTVPPVILELPEGNGDVLAAAAGDRVVAWRVENRRAVRVLDYAGDAGEVTALAAIGGRLCIGYASGGIHILDSSWALRLGIVCPEAIACFAGLGPEGPGFAYAVTEKGTFVRIDDVARGIFQIRNNEGPALGADETVRHLFVASDGVVLTTSTGRIHLPDRQTVPSAGQALALADVNGDGRSDVLYPSDGRIHAVDMTAVTTAHFPFPPHARDITVSSPAAADVTGDGETEILVTTSAGNLEIYKPDGKQIEGAPFSVGGASAVSPTIADLDRDGDLDCITVSEDGIVQVWDFPGRHNGASLPWGSYLRDPQHTARNPEALSPLTPGPDFFPVRLAYNYPNPNIENFTVIRYRLEQPAEVSIQIYDLAGNRIDSFAGTGHAPADNEVIWRLDGIGSGVYLCRIRASGAAGEKTAIFKIAVVK